MKLIADGTVNLILCDLPYGTTQNKWDSLIPLEPLWAEYKRILSPSGVVVLTAQSPFDKVLASSNLKWLRYEWIWVKENATGFLNAKKAPLKKHENVLVFAPGKHTYNPQFTVGKPYITKRNGNTTPNYGKHASSATFNDGFRYPTSVLEFPRDRQKLHPTQKPVALFEYLIRTYTNPGELVLDNCMGSGTTAIAAINTGRHFIGFEMDEKYFGVAQERIDNHRSQMLATA